jgi:SAM-dependent methyltransferase
MPSPSAAPPELFDRRLIATRRARVPAETDFVTELVLSDLDDRLEAINRRYGRAALVGPTVSAETPAPARVDALDLVPTLTPDEQDDMPLLPARDYDLIVSLLDLQAVNDVPGTLARFRRHLKPDGLFIAVALGGRSLFELRAAWIEADSAISGGATARVAPFMDVRDAGGLLQRAGFALPVSDTDTHKVRYADPLRLMHELKRFGAANPMAERPPRLITPNHMAAAIAAYPADADGRVTATLELIWMSGWAPDESQQKPLRPGSAEISLKEVLKPRN